MTAPNSNENNQNPRVVYVKEPKKPWYKRIGCMVSLTILAIIVIIILAISFAAKQVQDDADTEHAITYSITGDATDAIATYSTVTQNKPKTPALLLDGVKTSMSKAISAPHSPRRMALKAMELSRALSR